MSDDSSNTGENSGRSKGKPFEKGDPRINRKGRPRNFDALRKLAQEISNEVAVGTDQKPIVIDGHVATNIEIVMRKWITSKDPRLQIAFVEYSYGKVPVKQENYNIDLDTCTPEEIERLANGEDPARVLKRHTTSSGS